MKKYFKRTILTIFLLAIILSLIPTSALAASTSTTVRASSSAIKPGDSFTVTFTFSSSKLFGVQASFKYDGSVLKHSNNSDTSGSSGSGTIICDGNESSTSLSTTVTFVALKEGSSTISAEVRSAYRVENDEMKSLSGSSSSTKITVKKPAPKPAPSKPSGGSSGGSSSTTTPSKPKDEPEPEQEPEPEVNPVDEAVKVALDEKELYMWIDLSTVKIPVGFKTADITYKEEKVQGVKGENSDITMVYLTDKNGEKGAFYILDGSENLHPFINLNTTSKYTIMPLDDSARLPEGYEETQLELDGQNVKAWVHEDNPDFYLLYVMNEEGEKDFYLYDQVEKTMQRYSDRTVIVEVEKEPEPMTFFEKLSSDSTLLAVIGILGALTIILSATLVVLYRKSGKQGRH